MKKDFKEKWITALRSGNYTQGIGRLRSIDDHFCCLGVLCDLYDSQGWVAPGGLSANGFYRYQAARSSSFNKPPHIVLAELGLGVDQTDKLVTMNDTDRLTFDQIADYVEENL